MASSLASQSLYRYIIGKLSNTLVLACYFVLLGGLVSCSSGKYISRQADQILLSDSNLTSAHVGISIYDASANKYLYNHDGDKYFIPASNTKLFTCYAAMKHLGDSLVGLRYYYKTDSAIAAFATGDPTLLHPNFATHPVFNFLKATRKPVFLSLNWKEQSMGDGWAWNDYDGDDAAERSALPILGNLVTIKGTTFNWIYYPVAPSIKVVNDNKNIGATRDLDSNLFHVKFKAGATQKFLVPFKTKNGEQNIEVLSDTLGKFVQSVTLLPLRQMAVIHSQPTDSVLKPMMHRSDNFFAEQTLLMVSNEMTGVMNDEKIIDTLLKSDFKDLPQKPRWVDGSGLSRYNLFSPQDMVTVLKKMKTDFDWNRITTILATGGEGTITNYYIDLKNRIFAKTGTLSNNVALSGFLITKHKKTIIFSVLVNNHMGNTTRIRKAVEKFLTAVADKY
jgi:serine-type D-Ala-D-Ala carboxypeptidase/endopeptidase (penicillin-binding protein 4)